MARHKLLTEKEVSEWLGIPEATLKTQRSRPPKNRKPIPYIELPNGKVRYREDIVNQYIEESQRDSTDVRHIQRKIG
jgi:predicted site-specific integrase-resolvase